MLRCLPTTRCYDNASYTGHRYCINTTRAEFSSGQSSCNRMGGHLVTYQDIQEQRCAAAQVAMHLLDKQMVQGNGWYIRWCRAMDGTLDGAGQRMVH